MTDPIGTRRSAHAPRPNGRNLSLGPVTQATPRLGSPYSLVTRTAGYTWMRSVVAVLLALSIFLLLTPLVRDTVVALGWSISGADTPYADYSSSASRFERPVGMLAANLGLAVLIPVSLLLTAMLYGLRQAWLFSVNGAIRWRYLLVCLALAGVVLGGVAAVTVVVSATPLAPQPHFWLFLLVILMTSPLQAAAEEVFFRGFLLQALGSLVTNPWFGVVVSAAVFAFFHGGQNVPLFLSRLSFGLLAGALVLKTGGLEAAIGAHVVNNLLAYTVAGLTTGIAQARAIDQITWTIAGIDVGGFALFAVAAWLVARRLKIDTVVTRANEANRPL